MGYLLFKCSNCRKNLAVAQFSVGRTFSCPHCKSLTEAPAPTIRFPCTSCKSDLFAPNYLREQSFVCPNCERKITIPKNPSVLCPGCQSLLEIEDEYFHELGGRSIRCPSCDSELRIPRSVGEEAAGPVKGDLEKAVWTDFSRKTLRLDRLLADIPQVQSINDGKCPYCKMPLEKLSESSYLCKCCDRMLSLVTRPVKQEK